jgi:D-amino peptidase
MKILMSTDMEGCAGIFHRELQISSPTPQEWAKSLRVCTGEFVAAAEGAWAGGAAEIWIHAAHDIDVEMLPPGVQVIRGVRLWDQVVYQEGNFDAMVVVGQHGGAHLEDCALSHTCLPSWQIEAATGFQQGWLRQIAPQIGELRPGEFSTVRKVWLNGRLCGETSLIMTMAAGFGVPTACVCGDSHACAEAQELVPEVEAVPVKWGYHFRGARMLSPAGACEAIRAGVEQALRRLPEIPLMPDGPQEIKVQYVHPERADRSARWPGVRREDDYAVSATAPSARDLLALRFLFARPADALEGPTAVEDYEPPEWLGHLA